MSECAEIRNTQKYEMRKNTQTYSPNDFSESSPNNSGCTSRLLPRRRFGVTRTASKAASVDCNRSRRTCQRPASFCQPQHSTTTPDRTRSATIGEIDSFLARELRFESLVVWISQACPEGSKASKSKAEKQSFRIFRFPPLPSGISSHRSTTSA